jgi:prepilin-type N-terminal cleavage/methylation domain-containing protein
MLFRRKRVSALARTVRSNRGFVLIEVLVAVGVAGALMAVLIRSFTQTWSGIGYVREEAEGTMLARSMMAEATERKITPGSQEGVIGRYAWKLTTTVLPFSAAAAKKPIQGENADTIPTTTNVLYHLVIVLKGPSGRSNRLDTYKIAQAAQ